MRDGEVFAYLLQQLNHLPIAYVHNGNFDDSKQFAELNNKTMTTFIRENYRGTVIACGAYSFEKAEQGLMNNDFNLIAIGRPFIANPDLISRLKNNETILPYDASMLYKLI